jgi:hypothetical protein
MHAQRRGREASNNKGGSVASESFQAEWISARIRRDGREIELEFTDFSGGNNVVRMATAVLKKLIGTLAQVLCSANNNAGFALPDEPNPKAYEDAPGFVIAENVDLYLSEDGSAVLRVHTVSRRKWEVVLNPEHARWLSQGLAAPAAPKSMH